ncbi:hypothetical protein M8C21_002337 [Ambrosia artemisiifolia]|uniref:Uncharacterized protein n=1 Tax=Ambrosia artemisiifolia TaxID=4212 RepID=A0AAD5GYP9_AMBAR|nr:hypothetical protein M8C21_002337 [Ambrosia artemisiifolia]
MQKTMQVTSQTDRAKVGFSCCIAVLICVHLADKIALHRLINSNQNTIFVVIVSVTCLI